MINAIGIYRVGKTKFKRDLTTRTDEDIRRWLMDVQKTCQMIRDCELGLHWPKHTQSCTMYGKCEFHDVHVLGNEEEQEMWLEQQYMKKPWDYEHRDDEVVTDA